MFKILTSGCEPTRGSEFSACVDLYASEDVTIEAGATKLVGLGVCIDDKEIKRIVSHHYYYLDKNTDKDFEDVKKEFIKSHYLQLMLRSSLAVKGLMLGNGVGVIDLDFEDEIKMIIHNPITNIKIVSDYGNPDYTDMVTNVDVRPYKGKCFKIKKGDRIGQITLIEHKSFLFGIDTTATRTGGFGSTN